MEDYRALEAEKERWASGYMDFNAALGDAPSHDDALARLEDLKRRADAYQGAVCLTDEERKRVLWWLHQPVPPSPMKDLDVRIIEKLARSGGR